MDSNAQTTTIEVDHDSARIIESLKERAAAEGVPLDALLRRLADRPVNEVTAKPFYETATREEWLQAFNEWVTSHDPNTPVIIEDSREAIYGDDGR